MGPFARFQGLIPFQQGFLEQAGNLSPVDFLLVGGKGLDIRFLGLTEGGLAGLDMAKLAGQDG